MSRDLARGHCDGGLVGEGFPFDQSRWKDAIGRSQDDELHRIGGTTVEVSNLTGL